MSLASAPVITAAVIGRQLRMSAYQGEERREVVLEPTLISENFLFLRQAILAGLGIGLVPDYVVQEDIRRGDVRDHAGRLAAAASSARRCSCSTCRTGSTRGRAGPSSISFWSGRGGRWPVGPTALHE